MIARRDLDAACALVNGLRREVEEGAPPERLAEVERVLDVLFGCGRRLAVYGSLAPREKHHDQVASLGGEWLAGSVEGTVLDRGWGAGIGYPAMRWTPGARRVPVRMLTSDLLPSAWDRLDAFEGPDYRRILVPVETGGLVMAVANLYESRSPA
jgi:gamma-glutamylcyclotransferase (GGCT)/AIG2-like uncharacterized protein YtfP